ncbi:MAG: heme o synthase [Bacteroidota bacterium]
MNDFKSRLKDYAQLFKLRLSFLVVFSAAMSYLWATHRNVDPLIIWMLSIGGFFITCASNIFNQILEIDSDKFMKRTANRPLPNNRISINEAFVLAITLGLFGLLILERINYTCSVLGLIAMVTYVGIYTPMKRISPITIIPGAIAGSLPVVIGWVAATGEINRAAVILFIIQFIWQFPHTWSIAWLLNDEYSNVGIRMLPKADGKSKSSAIIIMLSTFLIIPAGLLLYMYETSGIHVAWILALSGITIWYFSYKLYRNPTDKSALGLMFSCFLYLPILLITLVIEGLL